MKIKESIFTHGTFTNLSKPHNPLSGTLEITDGGKIKVSGITNADLECYRSSNFEENISFRAHGVTSKLGIMTLDECYLSASEFRIGNRVSEESFISHRIICGVN